MRITIETTDLAPGGLESPSGLVLNGHFLVDEVAFFRAAVLKYYPRGGAGVQLQFSVTRQFDSARAAEVFYLMHYATIPTSGLLTVIAGVGADVQTLYLRDACVQVVAMPPYRGISVTAQYTILGGLFETDIPPEVPGSPDTGEETIVMRRGKVAITSGASSVVVAFSSPLSSAPTVTASVSRPAGGDAIWPIVDEDTVTTGGFTATLSGAVPDGTYKLHYLAVE